MALEITDANFDELVDELLRAECYADRGSGTRNTGEKDIYVLPFALYRLGDVPYTLFRLSEPPLQVAVVGRYFEMKSSH